MCEDAASVCTNLSDGEMSAPLLEDGALGFYRVSSPAAGVRRVSRIAFRLQKLREDLSEEQIEMSLAGRMIDVLYEKWLMECATRQDDGNSDIIQNLFLQLKGEEAVK